MVGVARLRRGSSTLTEKETALLEATVGLERYRILMRRPLTVAVGSGAYAPGLCSAFFALALTWQKGTLQAVLTALVAAVTLVVSLAGHEAGHLLFARAARGVEPRMLVLRWGGGVSVVEGRFADARSAALFAAGGPIASLLLTGALIAGGMVISYGPLHDGLLLTAALSVMLLVVNLLPIAPMDGFALFRSALWAQVGNRVEAERRAISWSRIVLLLGLSMSLLAFSSSRIVGIAGLSLLAMLTAQHRAFARALIPPTADDR